MTSDETYLKRLTDYAVERPSGCHEWTRYRTKDGYGRMRYGDRMVEAHRLALSLRGVSVEGLEVMHECDNPPCINPAHLRVGTHAENIADMKARGRAAPQAGLSNTRAIVRPGDVDEIRRRYSAGGITQRGLGMEYGLSNQQVSNIVRGNHWTLRSRQ